MTRHLLWQYSRFCELLQEHIRIQHASMHFEHEPGKVLEVDFAGDMLHYLDCQSGELIACPVFVAVLPFSGYSYVEALPNSWLPQVLRALNHCLEWFGGIPQSVKSDNMRQWVSRISRYEPKFTDMLEQWASHNNMDDRKTSLKNIADTYSASLVCIRC